MSCPVPFSFQTLTYEELVREPGRLRSVPKRSGVFRVFDVHDKLILLEKTHNLTERIGRFYGLGQSSQSPMALDLRDITGKVEFCRTDSPMETLLLLYGERRRWFPNSYHTMRTLPRYYLLKVNRRQRFPRLYPARQIKRGVSYFGPFPRRSELNRFKATLERTYRIRPCQYNIRGDDPYPDCLYFQMRTCSKPCNGDIGREAYLENIDDAIHFIQGSESKTVARMLAEIDKFSSETRFEEAQRLRQKMERISRARKDHRQAYADVSNFDFVIVMDSGSVKKRKIALVLSGRIAALEEHIVDGMEETLKVLIRAQRSAASVAITPERHYDEFCLVSSFLLNPVASVRLFPLGDDDATTDEIIRSIADERKARLKRIRERKRSKGQKEDVGIE